MNIHEQLVRLVLPKEILDYFDIVKIETEESDIDAMSMTIHLDERCGYNLENHHHALADAEACAAIAVKTL